MVSKVQEMYNRGYTFKKRKYGSCTMYYQSQPNLNSYCDECERLNKKRSYGVD